MIRTHFKTLPAFLLVPSIWIFEVSSRKKFCTLLICGLVLFGVLPARADSFPSLYASDKAWLQSSFRLLAQKLEKTNASDVDAIQDTMQTVLLEKMLPYVYVKYQKKARLDKASDPALRAHVKMHQDQLTFLVSELKKLGLDTQLRSAADLPTLVSRLPYERAGGDVTIYSDGSARLVRPISSALRLAMRGTLESRIKAKHAGVPADFVKVTIKRMNRYAFLLNVIPSSADVP